MNEAYLTGLADQVTGLNLSQWQSDRSNPTLATQVATDETDGQPSASRAPPR